jgi:hypothetical protein
MPSAEARASIADLTDEASRTETIDEALEGGFEGECSGGLRRGSGISGDAFRSGGVYTAHLA